MKKEHEIVHNVLNSLAVTQGMMNIFVDSHLAESDVRIEKALSSLHKAIELMRELRQIYQEKDEGV